jgi:transposase
MELWNQLELDSFWTPRLPQSRKGTEWLNVLKTLAAYRLLDPGSEWRLHRDWFKNNAMADLLDEDNSIAAKDTLYRCLDKLCEHKGRLFLFLKERWNDLFGTSYDVLLYDLTSTYFESDPPEEANGLRRFGYSRDKRSDCVQVVIALVVTPEGFPVAYEVMPRYTQPEKDLQLLLHQLNLALPDQPPPRL